MLTVSQARDGLAYSSLNHVQAQELPRDVMQRKRLW